MPRQPIFICGLATSLVALATLAVPGSTATVDARVFDALRRISGGGTPSSRVAIVAADEKSLAAYGRWPWPPALVGRLIERLGASKVAVIALDTVFDEQTHDGLQGSEDSGLDSLVAAMQGTHVVIGHVMTFDAQSPTRATPCVVLPLEGPPERPRALLDARLRRRLFEATGVDCSTPELTGAATSSGFLNLGADADGTLRRVPLVMSYRGGTVPSLAMAAFRSAVGELPVGLTPAAGRPAALTIGGIKIPLDDGGSVALRFRADDQAFPHVSAADVLEGRTEVAALEGRVVFVGTDSDLVRAPGDRLYTRLDLHATATDNLLQGDYITSLPFARAWTVAATLALGPLAAWMTVWLGYRTASLAAGALAAGLWLASAFALRGAHLFVSPLLPSVALLGTIGIASAFRFGRESFRSDDEQRRRQQAQELLVQSLMTMVEMRDPTTGRHARRTQGYCRLLAQRLAHVPGFREYLTQERIEFVSWLAPLHDIGKIGVRDAVLGKPSALSEEEQHEMRRHPMVGFEAISRAQRQVGMDSADDDAILQIAKDIVYTHHERWDGTGYPRGLRGSEIPIPGRIVAVVDVYDALVEARPYRRRIPHQEAVASITSGRGTQFDPEVVDAFVMVSSEFLELGTRLREEAVAGQEEWTSRAQEFLH